MAIMKEIDYNEIGTHFDLDECEKAYKFGGVNISWLDYTYPKPTCEDGMWDMDKYYNDFDKWWKNLSQEEQKKICIKINSEYGTN